MHRQACTMLVFVLLATVLPMAQVALKTAPLAGQQWALVVGAALVGTFWMEVGKWPGSRTDRRG
jgi:hypothetical protein